MTTCVAVARRYKEYFKRLCPDGRRLGSRWWPGPAASRPTGGNSEVTARVLRCHIRSLARDPVRAGCSSLLLARGYRQSIRGELTQHSTVQLRKDAASGRHRRIVFRRQVKLEHDLGHAAPWSTAHVLSAEGRDENEA